MHVKKTTINPTKVKLEIGLNQADLSPIKQQTSQKLGADLKVAGFRPGKAPLAVIEKNLDQNLLQSEVLENILLY